MLICLCHPTSDREVDAAIEAGARTVDDLAKSCHGAGTGCGACLGELRDRIAAHAQRTNACARDCAADLVSLQSRSR